MERKEILKSIQQIKQSQAWGIFQEELRKKFDNLYLQAMSSELSDSERVHKLEQQKGVAYALDLMDAIEATLLEQENLNEPEEEDDE